MHGLYRPKRIALAERRHMQVRRLIGREFGRLSRVLPCGCLFIGFYNIESEKAEQNADYQVYQDAYHHNLFGCSMGSELTEKQRKDKLRGAFMKMLNNKLYWDLHDRGLAVPKELFRIWNIKYPDVWNSETKYGKQKVFKFSYHVKTGELLIAPSGIQHNIMILNYGQFPAAEYVRGIFFRDKKIIYLRMHENLGWLRRTEEILRINDLPKSISFLSKQTTNDPRKNITCSANSHTRIASKIHFNSIGVTDNINFAFQ